MATARLSVAAPAVVEGYRAQALQRIKRWRGSVFICYQASYWLPLAKLSKLECLLLTSECVPLLRYEAYKEMKEEEARISIVASGTTLPPDSNYQAKAYLLLWLRAQR